MAGLSNSRWASKDGRASSVPASPGHRSTRAGKPIESTVVSLRRPPSRLEPPSAELARYSKIIRRMKWKLPFLDYAYRRATGIGDNTLDATEVAEAELMFRLDFFEYYMLCERALVHLQGVFGIEISRGVTTRTDTAASGNDHDRTKHRYHANVLEALDREDNPLHMALGVGDVRRQLARAKDLRNRWKNADEDYGDRRSRVATGRDCNIRFKSLATYDLAGILTSIHEGLDLAYSMASQFVAGEAVNGDGDDNTTQPGLSHMAMDADFQEEKEWGFMVEAMDWEAV